MVPLLLKEQVNKMASNFSGIPPHMEQCLLSLSPLLGPDIVSSDVTDKKQHHHHPQRKAMSWGVIGTTVHISEGTTVLERMVERKRLWGGNYEGEDTKNTNCRMYGKHSILDSMLKLSLYRAPGPDQVEDPELWPASEEPMGAPSFGTTNPSKAT